jgi:multiple RNA-binding domain-containing protein 1
LKKVRLPKKFDGNHRGFCFIEFVTRKDAISAVKALSRTHLYGRRLVIEWADQADEDESDLDGLREKAKRDMDHHQHNDSSRNKKIRFEE